MERNKERKGQADRLDIKTDLRTVPLLSFPQNIQMWLKNFNIILNMDQQI